MAEEWFRSPEWTPQAQADFEARLARSRPHNRAQYLRIKGLALRDAGEIQGARALWERVIADETEHWPQVSGALEHLGDSHRNEDPALAETYYRRIIADYPTLSGTTACVHLSLAELLLDRGDEASIDEAAKLLEAWIGRFSIPFPNAHFRFNLALIRAAQSLGDRETVTRAARTALGLATRGPVYPRQGDVGVVETDSKTLRRLKRLARQV
ncbi:MAG: tetratricopeptide repeat protein [Nocardioidaceae bacterium]